MWKTHTEARHAIFTWIESWYNPKRRHASLGQISPIEFERKHEQSKQNTPKNESVDPTPANENGLPTGCFAPVHNPAHVRREDTLGYKQASPADKPEPEHTTASNYRKSTSANLVENYPKVKNL